MGGKKETVVDTTPKQTQQLRDSVQGFIMDPKRGGIAGQGTAAAPTMPGAVQVMGGQPVSTTFNSGTDISRGMTRDVNAGPGVSAGTVSAERVGTQNTQSVDQLGGANSAFFQNMMGQLQPAFSQARSEGLTAAKESAGSLTGSGFANRLGSSINRSLGNEQATLANYATQGIGMEMNRQTSDAARQLQAGMANQGASLQAGMANQSTGLQAGIANQNANLQAGIANQGADQNFMNSLLTRNQQGLAAQQMGSQAEQFNSSQTSAQNSLQAQLDAQRNAMGYQGQLAVNQGNANNFMQLLGQQASLGAGPTTVQQSGGFGGFLGGLGGTILGAAAGPVGSAIGGKIGSKLFG
jgi:hypothetical protein